MVSSCFKVLLDAELLGMRGKRVNDQCLVTRFTGRLSSLIFAFARSSARPYTSNAISMPTIEQQRSRRLKRFDLSFRRQVHMTSSSCQAMGTLNEVGHARANPLNPKPYKPFKTTKNRSFRVDTTFGQNIPFRYKHTFGSVLISSSAKTNQNIRKSGFGNRILHISSSFLYFLWQKPSRISF